MTDNYWWQLLTISGNLMSSFKIIRKHFLISDNFSQFFEGLPIIILL